MKTIGSVDIGGTKIAVGAVREDGKLLKQDECPTEPEKGFPHAMKRVATMMRGLTDSGIALAGIGVAMTMIRPTLALPWRRQNQSSMRSKNCVPVHFTAKIPRATQL